MTLLRLPKFCYAENLDNLALRPLNRGEFSGPTSPALFIGRVESEGHLSWSKLSQLQQPPTALTFYPGRWR